VNISYSLTATFKFSEKRIMQDEVPFYMQVPKAGREAI